MDPLNKKIFDDQEKDLKFYQEKAFQLAHELDRAKQDQKDFIRLLIAMVLTHGGEMKIPKFYLVRLNSYALESYEDLETASTVFKVRKKSDS